MRHDSKKRFFIFLLIFSYIFELSIAADNQEFEIKRKIARMIIIGFDGTELKSSDNFSKTLRKFTPGGVILFDHDYHSKDKIKNISSPIQVKKLISQIRYYASMPLLIAVDQEGGKVMRLKPKNDFINTPSQAEVGNINDMNKVKRIYMNLAEQLFNLGFNCDFAPVVDLAINPENFVIVKLGRSFGKSSEKVVKYATIFIESLVNKGIIPVLKHFPGHGSSTGDSHNDFVDITNTWQEKELEPYKIFINEKKVDMIMTAHVFNRNLDSEFPATLSRKINTELLRNKLGFKGIIVSDDMQMRAITKQFSTAKAISLAINAGVDMLIFSNQLATIKLNKVINIIYNKVKKGNISLCRILESNKRINNLFRKYKLFNSFNHKNLDYETSLK